MTPGDVPNRIGSRRAYLRITIIEELRSIHQTNEGTRLLHLLQDLHLLLVILCDLHRLTQTNQSVLTRHLRVGSKLHIASQCLVAYLCIRSVLRDHIQRISGLITLPNQQSLQSSILRSTFTLHES